MMLVALLLVMLSALLKVHLLTSFARVFITKIFEDLYTG